MRSLTSNESMFVRRFLSFALVLAVSAIPLVSCADDAEANDPYCYATTDGDGTGDSASCAQIFSMTERARNAPICGPWQNTFGRVPRLKPAFPDTASTYDQLFFDAKSGDYDALFVHGEFPYARYFSLNLYDSSFYHDVASISDYEMPAEPGSTNPYVPGANRSAVPRKYGFFLVKEGVDFEVPAGYTSFTIGSDIGQTALMARVYRPDVGRDRLGDATLPVLTAYKQSGNATCPTTGVDLRRKLSFLRVFFFNPEIATQWDEGKRVAGDRLLFFRHMGHYFPNGHMKYIAAPLEYTWFGHDKVAVVTFKPPTFENTYQGGGTLAGDKDMRYWSFCMGELGLTTTSACVIDDEVRLNANGTATIVVAPSDMKDEIEAAGLNHLRWSGLDFYRPILIHRHMMPSSEFPGSMSNVPMIPTKVPDNVTIDESVLEPYYAHNFMGEYAPRGQIMTREHFRRWVGIRR